MTTKTFFEKFALFADAPNAVVKMRELVLSLAVQGKLVPQDLEDGPAEEIEPVRKLKSAASVIKNDYPFALPSNWQWKRLGQVSKLINGDRRKNYLNKAEYVQDVKNLVA